MWNSPLKNTNVSALRDGQSQSINLKGNFKDTKHRKLIELQFIINFETNKSGFNKDIYFLSKYDTFKHKG